jgi:F-type H+-transporting ATPase subunit a
MRGGVFVLLSLLIGGFLAASSLAQHGHDHDHKPAADEKKHDAHDAKGNGEHHEGEHKFNPMSHVLDDKYGDWHLFEEFEPRHIHLPWPLTKFMVLEVIAAVLVIIVYVPLARRMQSGEPPRGLFANMFESLLTFVRENIAKPGLGEHHADHHVPFLWTLFLFILFNNLLGMFPFGGSATASIYVTLGLALVVFFAIHGSAVKEMGFKHYLETMWPHIDVPFPMGFPIKLLVAIIEVVGILVRNAVLAVRLFANMFAGHLVLAVILGFIKLAAGQATGMWATVTISSVLGIVALSLLELFVAFLQAYIFTFLTALFMGMAIHPQH